MQSSEELYTEFESFRNQHRFSGKINELYAPANYLMDLGGKRMRPLLTLLAHQLYQDDISQSLHAALAVEVFHNFSLMHDDIMDASPLRRGQPTVHHKYNINSAILSGDWMLIHTYELLNKYASPLSSELIRLMNTTATEVCEGQQADINFETKTEVPESDYLEMIKNKTAVLLGAALRMGGMIAGGDITDQLALYHAGIHMGLAFQIMDDYLDAYSNLSGKIVGGDILQNKKTILYIHALHQLAEADKVKFVQIMNANDADKVKIILEYYSSTHTKEYVLALSTLHGKNAIEAIQQIQVSNERKSNLTHLFNQLLQRTY